MGWIIAGIFVALLLVAWGFDRRSRRLVPDRKRGNPRAVTDRILARRQADITRDSYGQ
ncbi:hypothetical protein EV193_102117 [Herbihabitans rhizosphaerae]|uniref:Uncharacterized protein n=1 Tax=Herbihabitans rhizosphaerae TaxID=1872711 RepID=A0A4Q7L3V3_9PSEU|nr:hypothetical protein [Herbihabitans rhizosphaerae]RZS43141.1 hypothetical protein EV193_102117 [Herbihabitans rhizosphaerae]